MCFFRASPVGQQAQGMEGETYNLHDDCPGTGNPTNGRSTEEAEALLAQDVKKKTVRRRRSCKKNEDIHVGFLNLHGARSGEQMGRTISDDRLTVLRIESFRLIPSSFWEERSALELQVMIAFAASTMAEATDKQVLVEIMDAHGGTHPNTGSAPGLEVTAEPEPEIERRDIERRDTPVVQRPEDHSKSHKRKVPMTYPKASANHPEAGLRHSGGGPQQLPARSLVCVLGGRSEEYGPLAVDGLCDVALAPFYVLTGGDTFISDGNVATQAVLLMAAKAVRTTYGIHVPLKPTGVPTELGRVHCLRTLYGGPHREDPIMEMDETASDDTPDGHDDRDCHKPA
ncbi:hypothetical protein MRX96_023593 [Rhipicephalus microplus]